MPDLVLLDLGLRHDGKDVIKQLRVLEQRSIVVRLCARSTKRKRSQAMSLGADNDYINKPFGIGELMARIRHGVAPRRARRAT